MRWRPSREYKTGQTITVNGNEVALPLWVGLILADGTEAAWSGYQRQPIPRMAREIFGHDYRTLTDLRWDVGKVSDPVDRFDVVGLAIFDTADAPKARQVCGLYTNSAWPGDSLTTKRGDVSIEDVIVKRWLVEDGR
jgi:hypothetical protein